MVRRRARGAARHRAHASAGLPARSSASTLALATAMTLGCGDRAPPAVFPRPEPPSLAEPLEIVAAIAFLAMTVVTFATIQGRSDRELMPSDLTATLLVGTLVPAMALLVLLGRRMALVLVKKMGRRTLTLGYAIAVADTILAPFTCR